MARRSDHPIVIAVSGGFVKARRSTSSHSHLDLWSPLGCPYLERCCITVSSRITPGINGSEQASLLRRPGATGPRGVNRSATRPAAGRAAESLNDNDPTHFLHLRRFSGRNGAQQITSRPAVERLWTTTNAESKHHASSCSVPVSTAPLRS